MSKSQASAFLNERLREASQFSSPETFGAVCDDALSLGLRFYQPADGGTPQIDCIHREQPLWEHEPLDETIVRPFTATYVGPAGDTRGYVVPEAAEMLYTDDSRKAITLAATLDALLEWAPDKFVVSQSNGDKKLGLRVGTLPIVATLIENAATSKLGSYSAEMLGSYGLKFTQNEKDNFRELYEAITMSSD